MGKVEKVEVEEVETVETVDATAGPRMIGKMS